MNIFELRLTSADISIKAIKILREYFPDVSIAEWKQKVKNGEPIFPAKVVFMMGRNL